MFICRDPKEEDGGRNLYAFLSNQTPNRWEYLGLGWGSYSDGWGYLDDFNQSHDDIASSIDESYTGTQGGWEGTHVISAVVRQAMAEHDARVNVAFALAAAEDRNLKRKAAVQVGESTVVNEEKSGVIWVPSASGLPTPVPNGTLWMQMLKKGFEIAYPEGLPQELIAHYMGGSGKPFHLTEAQMVELGANIDLAKSPEIAAAIIRLTRGGNRSDAVPVDSFHITPVGAHLNGTLGHFTVLGTGSVRRSANPETPGWYFEGSMSFYDRWDFDAATHRNSSAEARVQFGRDHVPGRPFDVTSPTVTVRQWERDPEATWSGSGQADDARSKNTWISNSRPGGG